MAPPLANLKCHEYHPDPWSASGISGTIVRGCQVDPCGGTAIFGQVVSDCVAFGYVSGISGGSASNCFAFSNGGNGPGLSCTTAQNCSGTTSSADAAAAGLVATTATNCTGTAFGPAIGLKAETAVGCQGMSDSGTGVKATNAATSKGVSNSSIGLDTITGSNCSGRAEVAGLGVKGTLLFNTRGSAPAGGAGTILGEGGISAMIATGCEGAADNNSIGLLSTVATNCRGSNGGGVASLFTLISVSSVSSGGPLSATYKYNQP